MIKPKRILAFMLSVAMTLSLFPTITLTAGAAGTQAPLGTPENPYQISTESQFREMASGAAGTYYELVSDIDITSHESNGILPEFNGILEGNNHKITGVELWISVTNLTNDRANSGGTLIGTLNGVVKNLNIESPKVSVSYNAVSTGNSLGNIKEYDIKRGLLVNQNNGTIDNVHIKNLQADLQYKKNCTNCWGELVALKNLSMMVYENKVSGKILNSSIQGQIDYYSIWGCSGLVYINEGLIANVKSEVDYDRVETYDTNSGIDYLTAGVFSNESTGVMYNVWVDTVFEASAWNAGTSDVSRNHTCPLCHYNKGKIEKCYYYADFDGITMSRLNAIRGIIDSTTQTVTEQSQFDKTKYNNTTNANTLNIDGLALYGENSNLKLVILNYANTAKVHQVNAKANTFELPYHYDSNRYIVNYELNGKSYQPKTQINITGDTAVNVNDFPKLKPVFTETILIPHMATAPTVWDDWEGTSEKQPKPTAKELSDYGAIYYIAKAGEDGKADASDFKTSYSGAVTFGDMFCVKYIIPDKVNGKFLAGTYELYNENYGRPSYKKEKITLNKQNYNRYIKYTQPSKIIACENPCADWPSISPIDESLYPTNVYLYYKKYRQPQKYYKLDFDGFFEVYINVEDDANFNATYFRVIDDEIYVSNRQPTFTYEPINAKHNTEFEITADVKAIVDSTNVEKPIKGQLLLYDFYIGEEKQDYNLTTEFVNGKATFTMPGIPAGSECKFTLRYAPLQGTYANKYLYNQKFTVGKGDPSITLETDKTEYGYGDDVMIYITAPTAASESELEIKNDANASANITFVQKNEDGKYVYRYEKPDVGNLKLKAKIAENDYYNEATTTKDITVNKQALTFGVSGDKQTYSPDTAREITIKPLINNAETSALSASDFTAKYYEVDENNNVLKSTRAVKAISAGKYLYVIGINNNSVKNNYYINRAFEVTDTTLPDINNYDNIGYMYITSGAENAQKPIFFKDGTVNLKVGGKFKNTLTNENGTTATYESSNKAVATVDENGEVTAIGKGTATITATSTRENSTPVYASYTVNVGLATKTLTANDFIVTAQNKVYDETKDVKLSAVLKDGVAYAGDNVKFEISGEFADENAADNKTVNYKITEITGTGAENYVLDNGMIESTVTANITKANVTIICAAKTTRIFDGNAQEVDVSAIANGKVFDSSNYTVKYNSGAAPSGVGVYPLSIELTEEAARNYTVTQPTATLEIKSATQDVFSIEGVPEVVYYGDSFTLTNSGATGTVTYSVPENNGVLAINGTNASAIGTGKVTITATSTKDGYVDRAATKTIEVKKRILTPTATATNRTYNGENGVDVTIGLENIANSESVTATATATMVNADAGSGKIVYVNNITLSGSTNYTLSTQSLQTTVDIEPITITDFEISADNKKYDGTKNATASVTKISDVLTKDAGMVEIVGSAKFDSENSGDRNVTYTASGLSGTKSQNYVLGKSEKTATAQIKPLKVDFVIGQTTFVYDKKDKKITASASDENGKIFKDFEIEYKQGENTVTPNEVGTYAATITLNDSTNYYTEQGEIEVTVSEATQDSIVIVGLPGTIQYGDSFELEAVGGADGGTYEWTSDNENVTISDNTAAKPTVAINGAVGDKVEISVKKTVSNYEPISAKVVFVPAAKTVTFDVSKLEQTYGAISPVTVNPNDANATYNVTYNGSDTLPTNVGTYTVTVKAYGNYTGTQSVTLTIKKATATGEISGVNNSYIYGTPIDKDDITATSTMSGVAPKITFAGTGIYVPQEEVPTKVGNYTVVAEFTDSNYETLTKTKDFVIEKAPLTVKAKKAERVYGDANPIFELEYTGFVNGETKDVLLAEPVATVNANASSPITDENTHYFIKVSGGSAENYKFVYDNTGELEIKPTTDGTLYITGSSNTVRVNDVFTLHAFYGNNKVNAVWGLSDDSEADIVTIDQNGMVTAKKAGTVTITATADKNYGGKTAEFTLTVKQTVISLTPTELVKTYTGDRQDISFAENADFTPVLSGAGKNVDVTYALISDPSVTEPVKVGTYSVAYTINDESYTGGGNATMYINKATVAAKAKDDVKVYGDEYTGYDIEITNNGGITNATALAEVTSSIKSATTFASDGAAKTAVVKDGGYDIIPTLSKTENDNVKFTVDNGILTVNKAPLTVKVKDVTREYGAANPTLEAEYAGFKNEETKDVLSGELVLAYDESIKEDTAVGKYEEKTSADGLTADNYEITFEKGDVTITKIAVNASGGTSRANYLTVKFDKAVEGATFKVTDKNGDVELTSVTASSDYKTYNLNGTFTVGTAYTVEITYDNATQDIVNKTLTITPYQSSSGGSGGSGGGGGGGSAAPASYTVTFDTNGGSKINSVKVEKNNTVKEPTAPTKDGFVFDGWYTDKKLTKKYDFDTKVTKSTTLYAKWTEKKDDNKDDSNKPSDGEWKNPFTDVSIADWFYENVRYANENGLMSGTSNTEFAPNMTLTRGMLVTVLYRLAGEPAVNKSIPFADVNADSYYANAVAWAQQNGIVSGISETEFAPDENITREQIAVIMYRYAKFKGYDVSAGENTNILSYTDFDEVSGYAVEAMQYAVGSGLIKGKTLSTLNPQDSATRAETAAILNRFIEGNK